MSQLTHLDSEGNARMVDVTQKEPTDRTASAIGSVTLSREAFTLLVHGNLKKGDGLTVARIAGIAAAKKTWDLIPLCHPLPLTGIDINLTLDQEACRVDIESTVSVHSSTGVEMEALTAVSVAALTIYDMCKGVDRSAVIHEIRLLSKSGGKSGDFERPRIG